MEAADGAVSRVERFEKTSVSCAACGDEGCGHSGWSACGQGEDSPASGERSTSGCSSGKARSLDDSAVTERKPSSSSSTSCQLDISGAKTKICARPNGYRARPSSHRRSPTRPRSGRPDAGKKCEEGEMMRRASNCKHEMTKRSNFNEAGEPLLKSSG